MGLKGVRQTTCVRCGAERTAPTDSYCRPCRAAYGREYYGKNKEKLQAYSKAMQQKLRETGRVKKRKTPWKGDPQKKLEQVRKWRAANKERFLHLQKNYRNKRRAATAGEKVSLAEWKEIKEKHGNRCCYCGKKFKHLTMDHAIPVSRGGRNIACNIVPACLVCNSRKGSLLPIEFAQTKQGKLL